MRFRTRFLAVASCLAISVSSAAQTTVHLPNETAVYLVTPVEIIAKRKNYDVGDTIPVEVWRDVVVDGRAVIKAGTPATLRVDSIKGRSVVGIRGKVSFGAVETTASDGQTIHLGGGYNKQGAGRVALSATLGALVFFPALFIPGGVPRFPADTVFNAYVAGSYNIAVTGPERPIIQLGTADRFTVAVDYDKLLASEEPEVFEFVLRNVDENRDFVIDSVNGEAIKPLKLQTLSTGNEEVRASIEIKKLANKFRRGINRFEVAFTSESGDRVFSEVVLDIEF